MPVMRSTFHNDDEIPMWRLAAATVTRTVLAFTLPYLVAYYTVIGAWRGIHLVTLWLTARR
jgi:hypothetical protein